MAIILALTSALSHAMGNVSLRAYQTKLQKTTADLRLFQCLYIFAASVLYFLSVGGRLELTGAGLWLALLYGLDLALCFMMTAACYNCGPMSLTSIITNACVVLPILVGCIWYDEVLRLPQIIGCVLLAVTFLLSGLGSGAGGKISLRWYPMVFFAFFLNGMGAVLLNIYGRVAPAGARNSFLSLGYFAASVFLLGVFLSRPKVERPGKRAVIRPLFFLLAAICCLGSFVGNGILMSLNTAMPATILYPLVNGGIGVFVAIASVVIYREKLTVNRLFAVLTGLGAIVVLNL